MDPTDALLMAASQDPGDRAIALMEFTGTDLLFEAGLAYYHAGNYAKARTELEKLINTSTLVLKTSQQSERLRLDVLHTIALVSLMMPNRNMQEIRAFLMAFLEGAKVLQSTFVTDGARSLYHDMITAFPSSEDIEDLRTQLPPRKKKAPDA